MTKLRKILYILLTVLFSISVYAQTKQEPKDRNIKLEEPVIFKDSLPKISLPDFVITGQEKIEISDRNKIEISEDNIYQIPQDMAQSFESRDITPSPIETIFKKRIDKNLFSENFSGFVKGEIGNYNSYTFSAGTSYETNNYKIGFIGDYINRGENITNSDYYKGNGNLFFTTVLPETDNIFNSAKVNLNLFYNTKNYKFYGTPDYVDYFVNIPYPGIIKEKTNAFSIAPSILSEDKKYFEYYINILYNYFKDDKSINDQDFQEALYHYTENTFNFTISGKYDFENYLIKGQIFISNNNISLDNKPRHVIIDNPDKNAFLFAPSISVEKSISNYFYLLAGLKFYSYQNLRDFSWVYRSYNNYTKSIILPQVKLVYENNNNLSISLNYLPDIEIMSLQKSYQLNPYLINIDYLEHIINRVNLYLNIDYSYLENLRIKTLLGYNEQENPIVYSQYSNNFYIGWLQNQYNDNAKGFYSKFDVNYSINDKNNIQLKIAYQNKRIDSQVLPYTPDFVCSLDYITKLYFGLLINPSIEFISKRRVDNIYKFIDEEPVLKKDNAEYLKEIFLFNIFLEYNITNNIIANVRINDLFNTRYSYYNGYEEFPFSIFAGIKFKW